MVKFLLVILLSFGFVSSPIAEIPQQSFPIKNLYQVGDVFNIEAGRPAKALAKDKIWVNIAMVLDRPLIDGVTLDEITEKNNFPLKEMSIPEYNETNVNLSLLLITNYYLENGHRLLDKSPSDPLKLLIQVHRNSSGPKMIEHIAELLTNCLNQNFNQITGANGLPVLALKDKNILIEFRKGVKNEALKNYDNVDILFSVSLVGGLNPKLPSGTLTYAKEFIPFNIETYELFPDQQYKVNNRLNQDLDAILAQAQEIYFDKLNNIFKSQNHNKKHLARKLTKDDFHVTKSLQIEGNFYPKDPEKMVSVVQ